MRVYVVYSDADDFKIGVPLTDLSIKELNRFIDNTFQQTTDVTEKMAKEQARIIISLKAQGASFSLSE